MKDAWPNVTTAIPEPSPPLSCSIASRRTLPFYSQACWLRYQCFTSRAAVSLRITCPCSNIAIFPSLVRRISIPYLYLSNTDTTYPTDSINLTHETPALIIAEFTLLINTPIPRAGDAVYSWTVRGTPGRTPQLNCEESLFSRFPSPLSSHMQISCIVDLQLCNAGYEVLPSCTSSSHSILRIAVL